VASLYGYRPLTASQTLAALNLLAGASRVTAENWNMSLLDTLPHPCSRCGTTPRRGDDSAAACTQCARIAARVRTSSLQRLTTQTIALAEAMQADDRRRAHQLACDLRDLSWSMAIPGAAAAVGALVLRLSDIAATWGELDLALDDAFAELYRATTT